MKQIDSRLGRLEADANRTTQRPVIRFFTGMGGDVMPAERPARDESGRPIMYVTWLSPDAGAAA